MLLRFSWSALLLLPFFFWLRHHQWTRGDLLRVIGCSIAGVAGYKILFGYGSQWVPAGITGLLIATEPIWVALISVVLLVENGHLVAPPQNNVG